MEDLLVCPFTNKPLRPFSELELEKFHQRVEAGDFYFQKGIALKFKPEKAYISQNNVYIYLEVDGVLLLQKQTAIVPRNRIENPLRRVVEEAEAAFYQSLGLNADGTLHQKTSDETPAMDSSELGQLKQVLPKGGQCFVSMGTAQVDTVHNLLFGTSYNQHVHVDFDMKRLNRVVGTLESNTSYVLCDPDILPVAAESIDGIFCSEYLESLEKEGQKKLFESLCEAMRKESVAIMVRKGEQSTAFEGKYKVTKAKAALSVWKKQRIPHFHFHAMAMPTHIRHDAISGKTSWGSQMS